MATGVALQAGALAWLAAIGSATVAYASLVGPFVMAGIGMGMFFAPVANVVLSAVRPEEEGQASGANSAVRELGGVFGVAVLASVFAHYGGYRTGTAFTSGVVPSVWIGAAVVLVGALAALAIGLRRRQTAAPAETALELAA
jgi:MFS family permease